MHREAAVHYTHLALMADAEGALACARGATGCLATPCTHVPPWRAPKVGAAGLHGRRLGAYEWAPSQVGESVHAYTFLSETCTTAFSAQQCAVIED